MKNRVEYFSEVADSYMARYFEESPGGYSLRVRQQRIFELFDRPGSKVLDVGCGPGVMAQFLIDQGCEYWGLDASHEMIAHCKRSFENEQRCHPHVGSATQLPFPDASFDSVIAAGVLEHIDEDDLALREMVRVLREDGVLILALANRLSPHNLCRYYLFYPVVSLLRPAYFRFTKKVRRPALGRPRHQYIEYSSSKTVRQLNCEVIDLAFFNFNPLLSPLDELFPQRAILAARKCEQLRFGKLKWLGGGFIIKAKKRHCTRGDSAIQDSR